MIIINLGDWYLLCGLIFLQLQICNGLLWMKNRNNENLEFAAIKYQSSMPLFLLLLLLLLQILSINLTTLVCLSFLFYFNLKKYLLLLLLLIYTMASFLLLFLKFQIHLIWNAIKQTKQSIFAFSSTINYSIIFTYTKKHFWMYSNPFIWSGYSFIFPQFELQRFWWIPLSDK